MQINSIFAFGARFVRSTEIVFKHATLSSGTRRVPAMNTPQCVNCSSVPAPRSALNDSMADGTSISSRAVGAPNSDPNNGTPATTGSSDHSALSTVAAPEASAQAARSQSAKTFYKRTLPCPPAIAFSSEEGAHSLR